MAIQKMKVLVIGGYGFIGQPVVHELLSVGHEVLILDQIQKTIFQDIAIQGSYGDSHVLRQIFSKHNIDVVIHLAGNIVVSESVENPIKYYRNNVINSLNLLEEMEIFDVKKIVFSSSAAVYGNPRETPISEAHPLAPINPYGKTKLIVEHMIKDFAQAYKFKYSILRYFNAAGPNEHHIPETHLIPLLLDAAKTGNEFQIFGNKFKTPDGTCVRDYIHTKDLAIAHVAAMTQICSDSMLPMVLNLGTNKGISNLELLRIVEEVTGKTINLKFGPKRDGDPDILIADNQSAKDLLKWKPKYSDIRNIVKDAWESTLVRDAWDSMHDQT